VGLNANQTKRAKEALYTPKAKRAQAALAFGSPQSKHAQVALEQATPGVGGNFQAGLGKQLSSRVSSGAISPEQAEDTAHERELFERAYGTDWRQQVYGDNVHALRTGLAGDQANNPQYQAAYAAAMTRRKRMLERAKTKLNGGTTAPGE
jgi:hypothetical protein